MLTHYRRRRGLYSVAPPRPAISRRLIASAAFIVVFLYFFGGKIVHLFGFGGPIERLPATVSVEEGGTVNVTLDGGNTKRAENGMKIFEGEKISTGGNGHATLRFFEGTLARLDASTEVDVLQSTQEKKDAFVSLSLQHGSLWLTCPGASGSSLRTVKTPFLTFDLPPNAEVLLSPTFLQVYNADREGVRVSLAKHDPVMVGEGQQLSLPESTAVRDIHSDLYTYRSPLNSATPPAFITQSKTLFASYRNNAQQIRTTPTGDLLTIRTPKDGEKVMDGTVSVSGTVDPSVKSVRINGYAATLDPDTHTFAQVISLPAGESAFAIRISALDAEGNPLAESQRTVSRGTATSSLPSPEFTVPAKTGETYRTSLAELVIRGTSPLNAAAIYVNNYKLQLFTPSKGTWSYLASLSLGNMKPGTNTYDVVVEDQNGNKSAPARITIIQEQGGRDGVIATDGSSSAASAPVNPGTLPTNAPTAPGSLSVTGAAAQLGFIATGTGFVLEGITSPRTASVWVNDYQLKLYKQGKTYWNYLASPDLKTLKEGKNTFTIVARDRDGTILDQLAVNVEYQK